jgi:hypothetical protein
MEAYLEGTEPDEATLKRLIRKATRTAPFYPVLCGSAFKNKGVQPLLDAVVDYLPSPSIAAIKGVTTTAKSRAQARRRRAVVHARLQDHGRPFVGSSPSAASIRARSKGRRAELDPRQEGARRPHAADARQQPRGHQGSLMPATSSRWPA